MTTELRIHEAYMQGTEDQAVLTKEATRRADAEKKRANAEEKRANTERKRANTEREKREETVRKFAALHMMSNSELAELTGFTVKEVEAILSRK